ncbi:DUF222 domain-containing protein, partial [Nocardioides sp.]|uniref:DUF222 domain-containing protein n=1 Tax=Nocardioides sp. TaxID=35761 RepID=UPI0031FE9C0A
TLQVGAATGVVSTANWWAHHTRQDRLAAHKAMRLAQALDTRFEKVRVAMGAGDVSVEQATVIVRGLGALPADPDPALVTQGRGAADRARRGPRPARVAEPRPRHPDDRGTGDR